jgi:D-alanyl-D-alanine carboxypeptidase
VSCLSGYLKTSDDRWYAFSFLMNDVTRDANPKLVHEKILTIIDREKP